jgi:hypothetical protein
LTRASASCAAGIRRTYAFGHGREYTLQIIVLLGGVPFCDASRHRLACSVDLVSVVHSLLAEHRQQDDAATEREVVRDSEGSPVEIEAKLEQAAVQRSRDRYAHRRAWVARRSRWNATAPKCFGESSSSQRSTSGSSSYTED